MTISRNPVALITGGRRGIGLGIAHTLALAGFDVAITGLSKVDSTSADVLDRLNDTGSKSIYIQSDLADLDSHAHTLNEIEEKLGAIDCLVNNAGMASVERVDFVDLKPENFDQIIDTNLRGTIFFTQAVAKSMLNNSGSVNTIINITSVSASMCSPERMDYCISKAGLASFSANLALSLANKEISVFEVRPGIIRSDMTSGVVEKYNKQISDGIIPAKRWGEPEDVGNVVAKLATGAFSFATGSIINVDGGLSIPKL